MKDKSKNIENKYFPILIDLSKFRILVIGGGKVAERKVNDLLNFNGKVTVLAPRINDEITRLGQKKIIKIINKSFDKADLENYDLVFSTIDDPVISKLIADSAKDMKKLINSADIPELCDFILPANIIRGPLTVSIGSQGVAPFYVKYLKSKLELILSPYLANIIVMAGKFRDFILKNNINDEKKAKLYSEFVDKHWEKIIEESGTKGMEKLIEDIFEKNNVKIKLK